ncbi:MAG: MBL fold metallo-hydrolase, partial [Balneolaceae bacterium]
MPSINVTPLYEGTFSVGLDKKFVSIGREDPPEKGALKLSINPFLIQTNNRNILFDAGLGDFGEDTSTEIIKQNLAGHNLSELDITDIFASHLHYDHLGGLAGRPSGYWELTFPDAKLWVSRKEWEKLIGMDGVTDDEIKLDFLHFLEAKADLHYLEDEDQPYPDIRVKKIGGHTEYSQALFYENGSDNYLMAGDVIGTKSEINRKFAAKYDFDPKRSMEVREELKSLALRKGTIILAYHETDTPMFKLT